MTLVILAAVGLIWISQRRLIYLPTQNVPDIAVALPGIEEVTYPTGDGLTLAAWFMPATGEQTSGTVVVFNGNAGNRANRLPLGEAFARRGYAVLLVDYRGYGGNPGRPSEEGLGADARAAVAYLKTRSGFDSDHLVYFGESLGAAIALGLVDHQEPAVLVLRSPFTSLPDV
ncbi:MAG: alpha/beta fold hydrolase, partial [Acidimicrobiia bacterium]